MRKLLIVGLVALGTLWAAPSFASDFTLTGVQGGVMGGVYTSPYTATIGFQQGVLVICDDFVTESYIGDTFTATGTSVASLSGESAASTDVKFDHTDKSQQQTDYATAAFLAEEIIGQGVTNTPANDYSLGVLSYAMWGVFDPSLLTSASGQGTGSCSLAYGCLTAGQLADAQLALANAVLNAGSVGQYTNVSIYTPSPNQNRSQEFLVVKTPEPSTLLMLGLGFAGLLFFGTRRRRVASSLAY